ncbi:AP-1 complex subunit gamma-like 2 [Coemansia sp. RSA 2673]|nr:AP-1 complex subunit gamma-like 2 [Coemansia sp. RSA 2673]
MVVAGTWLVGEYGDLLVARSVSSSAEAPAPVDGIDDDGLDILGALGKPIPKKGGSFSPDTSGDAAATSMLAALDPSEELPQAIPEPMQVVQLLTAIAKSPIVSSTSRHVALTALAKLPGRFAHIGGVNSKVRQALSKHAAAMDVETQARAVEFGMLLSQQLDSVRAGVVDRMPAPEYTDVPYEEYLLNPTAMRPLRSLRPPAALPPQLDLLATFYNEGDAAVSDLNFLVAVPKSQKLQIQPPSGQHISVGSTVTQLVRVSNPTKSPVRLRIKLGYVVDSQEQEAMFEYSGFPSTVV